MFAIATFGTGKPVTARAIEPDWNLVEGEAFKVEVWEPGMILDADGVTVRHPTAQELEETPEQTIKRLDSAIERHIQAVMDAKGYESIERLIGAYSNSTNPVWKAEANAAGNWLTAIWEYSLQVIADVEAGTRTIPTEAELIAELPLFETFLQP